VKPSYIHTRGSVPVQHPRIVQGVNKSELGETPNRINTLTQRGYKDQAIMHIEWKTKEGANY
jgi:hypothetical protein